MTWFASHHDEITVDAAVAAAAILKAGADSLTRLELCLVSG
jgi:hypothetical protein